MKKFFMIGAIALACMSAQNANAQSILQQILSGVVQAQQGQQTNQQTTQQTTNSKTQTGTTNAKTQAGATNGQDVLGILLNNAIGQANNAAAKNDKTSKVGNLIGNLISTVTGGATTTQANLIGNWSYTAPSVQFESNDLLTMAGGASIATKCETKLAQYYKVVGIKPGNLKFTFAQDGTCSYSVGARTLQGKYVFDSNAKTVTITTASGQNVKAYVTISGNNMALCFDGTKLLTLFNSISSKFSSLSTVSALASNYKGMKVGFKFSK